MLESHRDYISFLLFLKQALILLLAVEKKNVSASFQTPLLKCTIMGLLAKG